MPPTADRLSRRGLVLGASALLACANNEKAKAPSPSARLWFGGDVHVGEVAPRLQALSSVFGKGMGVVNLEGPVGEAPFAVIGAEAVQLANHWAAVGKLADAGVDVVGIANNHMGDRGQAGETKTRATLARAGLLAMGRSAGRATLRLANQNVALCAFELPFPGLGAALRKAAKGADILTVSFHVTGPPSYLPSAMLRAAVDDAVAVGARVVVAHGTHALGPVERRAGKRADVIIAWGLGNLLFNCECTRQLEGAILNVRIDGARTEARITPIDAGLMGAAARPAQDVGLLLDLLEAIGSTTLTREHGAAVF